MALPVVSTAGLCHISMAALSSFVVENQARSALCCYVGFLRDQYLDRFFFYSTRPSETVLKWLTSFVTGRTQAVSFDGNTSSPVKLICGVPQGSVLGPLLFVMYAAEVMKIAQKHGVCIHAYADDLQTYVSCNAVDQHAAITKILSCVEGIDEWMSSNRLKSVSYTHLTLPTKRIV